ncbi:MAG: NAD(P)H-dependent oxidoreductase [Calditrichaceae bacterium]|nr:NAD(P)H-dependent oxidoreductase [Calditrichaceae bacterium]MBN2707840.1 NAD(P)H-dependent oxidoreductase [Calditrichaceae bacterium]RQV94906.1 MAG: NADPH-dependent oxidoreductase [Calditrichota bacterium]
MNIAIVASSLSPKSNSRILAQKLAEKLSLVSIDVDFIDLRDFKLPLCGDEDDHYHPLISDLTDRIAGAAGIVIASPIYNYGINAAMKNLVELTGKKAWHDKVVGFICAAGGRSSYMSVMSFANSLMLDFHCLIIPKFIYIAKDFDDINHIPDDLKERLDQLAVTLVELAEHYPVETR